MFEEINGTRWWTANKNDLYQEDMDDLDNIIDEQ